MAENQSQKADPAINERELMERLGGDHELLLELIPLFLDDCPALITEIKSAAEKADTLRLRRAAHTLKGALGNFSAYPAYRAAFSLEQMGFTEDLSGVVSGIHRLDSEMERLVAVLKGYL